MSPIVPASSSLLSTNQRRERQGETREQKESYSLCKHCPDSVQINWRREIGQRMSLSPSFKNHHQQLTSALGGNRTHIDGSSPVSNHPANHTNFSVTDILTPIEEYQQSSSKKMSLENPSAAFSFNPYRSAAAQPSATQANPYFSHCAATGFGSHGYGASGPDFSTCAAAAAVSNPSAGWYGAAPDPRFGSEALFLL